MPRRCRCAGCAFSLRYVTVPAPCARVLPVPAALCQAARWIASPRRYLGSSTEKAVSSYLFIVSLYACACALGLRYSAPDSAAAPTHQHCRRLRATTCQRTRDGAAVPRCCWRTQRRILPLRGRAVIGPARAGVRNERVRNAERSATRFPAAYCCPSSNTYLRGAAATHFCCVLFSIALYSSVQRSLSWEPRAVPPV